MSNLTAKQLRELVYYCDGTGVFTSKRSGKTLGGKTAQGYVAIGLNYKRYLAHRLAWLYVYGEWPKEQIDHINGNRADNRVENLRAASNAENQQNLVKAKKSNKSSGLLGAYWHCQNNCWKSQIKLNGKLYHLGQYNTAEEAHAAYLKAKASLHSFGTIARS